MRRLMAKKTEGGNTTIVKMKIEGKIIFFKTNNNAYATPFIQQLREKGAFIFQKKRGWIECNVFGDNATIKIGKKVFDFHFDIIYELRRGKTINDINKYFQKEIIYEKDGLEVSLDIKAMDKEEGRQLIFDKKILTGLIHSVKDLTEENTEEELFNFSAEQYIKAGFKVKEVVD